MRTLRQAANGAAERMHGSSMYIGELERHRKSRLVGAAWGRIVRKQGSIMIPEENL